MNISIPIWWVAKCAIGLSGRAVEKGHQLRRVWRSAAARSIDGGRLLIPFVKAICVDIRPAEKLIEVDIPEGLEDINT